MIAARRERPIRQNVVVVQAVVDHHRVRQSQRRSEVALMEARPTLANLRFRVQGSGFRV